IKQLEAVRTLVEKEAIKNYLSLAITAAIKKYATTTLELGKSTHLIVNSNLKVNVAESVSYLIEKGYVVKNYCVLQKSTKAISKPRALKKPFWYSSW
ncbi:8359_t:CDS:2, partial [Cetraspora pellucida]